MGQYLPLLAMVVLALGFCVLSYFGSKLLAPKRPSVAKSSPYECGIVPTQEPPERFPVRFYLIAMIFIVFDIEIIFLYPYAVVYERLGGFGLAEIIVFAVPVFASFLFLIANGALDWGPVNRLRRQMPEMAGVRTSSSTVRRVGLEGREDDVPPRREEAA